MKNVVYDIKENNYDNPSEPFIKWVGGKRALLKELVKRLPGKIHSYYEPFVGGGALFFYLNNFLSEAYLSDVNSDLINTYKVVKEKPLEIIKALGVHSENHNKNYYYKIRSQHNLKEPIEIAARFIYLNKTCYNGLYRVNKSGEFNVPMGKYIRPNIIQEKKILSCSSALNVANINCIDFDEINPKKGDFVYFDPPYHPYDSTSFTTYTKSDFNENDQVRLKDFIVKLTEKKVNVMLSNSNTEFIRNVYDEKMFNIDIVTAPRYINCKGNSRGAVEEVIIRNYETN